MTTLDWVEEVRRETFAIMKRPAQRSNQRWDWAHKPSASNYRQHLRHGEKPCTGCRIAEADRDAKKRRKNKESADKIRGALWQWQLKQIGRRPGLI